MKSFSTLFIFLSLIVFMSSSLAQVNWTKYPGNPVFKDGQAEAWDDAWVHYPHIIHDSTQFIMFYTGFPEMNWNSAQVGRATSDDGITWYRYEGNPIIPLGPDEEWDDAEIQTGPAIFDGSIYRIWYCGYDGWNYRSGLATSPDEHKWTKYNENPVFDLGKSGEWDEDGVIICSVLLDGSIYKMWYVGKGDTPYVWRIGYATSGDGINWDRHEKNPVLDLGDPGSWDERSQDNVSVLYNQNLYEMWYQGWDNTGCGRIGYATSLDGIKWDKHENNPILVTGRGWESSAIVLGSVLLEDYKYKMWYQGQPSNVIGYAEDFAKIAHSDSICISATCLKPEHDTLRIETRIVNPNEHSLSVLAQIVLEDSTVIDSIDLSDDGNEFWSGEWLVPDGESIYQVGIKTVDEELETIHDGLVWSPEKFTTIGPIVVDSMSDGKFRSILNPNLASFDVVLKNLGQTTTAKNVGGRILPDTTHPCFESNWQSYKNFGDIEPGQRAEARFSMLIDDACLDDPHMTIPFTIEIESGGTVYWFDSNDIVVGIQTFEDNIPLTFNLEQNHPNPFNPTTKINYELPITNYVHLSVYNLLGQKLVTLVGEKQNAGYHQVEWDASGFASGVYFYRIEAGEFVDVKKMILLR